MADTVNPTETAPVEPVKNEAPAAQPSTNNAELEQLRKERDQAEMRARQLEREAEARRQKEDEDRRKKLEQDSEYKTLYEREREERERLQSEREAEQRRNDIRAAESSILSGYASEIRDAAQDLGISLADDSEESKAAFAERLQKVQERLGAPAPRVIGNNQAPVIPNATDVDAERAKMVNRLRFADNPEVKGVADQARSSLIGGLSAIKEMKRSAGIQVDE